MPLAVVRAVNGAAYSDPSVARSMSSAPTAGNLLLATILFSNKPENTYSWNETDWFVVNALAHPNEKNYFGVTLGRYVQSGDTATLPAFAASASNTYHAWSVHEVSGVTGTWATDFHSTITNASSSGSSLATASRRTTVANVLAIGVIGNYDASSVMSTPSGWTLDQQSVNFASFGAWSAIHKEVVANDSDVSLTFTPSNTAKPQMSSMVLLAGAAPTRPTVVRSRIHLASNALLYDVPFGKPTPGNLVARIVFWGSGVDGSGTPTIDTAKWTEIASRQNGSHTAVVFTLARFAESGDTWKVPAASTTGSNQFHASVLLEIAGLPSASVFGDVHVGTKTSYIAGGTSGPDVSPVSHAAPDDDCLVFTAHAAYDAAVASSVSSGIDAVLANGLKQAPYGALVLGVDYLSSGETAQATVSPGDTSKKRFFAQMVLSAAGAGGSSSVRPVLIRIGL